MAPRVHAPHAPIGFPRFFTAGGLAINSYKFFLIVGLYIGSIATAVLAQRSGIPPLGIGLGAMSCALAGLIGARVYHLLVAEPRIFVRSPGAVWDSTGGGWSVLGALLTFVPATFLVARLLHLPAAVLWDHLGAGILAGGFWIRLGCVFNGCCGGRETQGRLGVVLHDVHGVRKRRIPVQFLEMAWWLAGSLAFLALWRKGFPEGSYGLGTLAWYGTGRFFLEPLRERPVFIAGGLRINQIAAGALALGAGAALGLRAWGS